MNLLGRHRWYRHHDTYINQFELMYIFCVDQLDFITYNAREIQVRSTAKIKPARQGQGGATIDVDNQIY